MYFHTDKQLFEIVAGVILAHDAHRVENAAVGEHDLQAAHVGVHAAIAQVSNAARVCRHVAANVTATLGGQIERHRVTVRLEVAIQLFEHDALAKRRKIN